MNKESLLGTHAISSLQELDSLATEFSNQLHRGDVVLLKGDLGAGKTTFSKFLGKAIGVRDEITSPTYTIVAEYPVQNNSDITKFIHLDIYRSNLDTNYVQEILRTAEEQEAIVIIEWPENLKIKLTGRYWEISISVIEGTTNRVITIIGLH